MIDVMIDLETLGNGKNAVVIQIGACYFNRETGEIGKVFSCNVDAGTSEGGELDASTVYWWLQQSDQARNSILTGELLPCRKAFAMLNLFLADARCIWSHATFDFVIIMETLKRLNLPPLFSFRAARDIRTLQDLAGHINGLPKRKGIHHNGLDDAIYQVSYCVPALNKLKAALQSYQAAQEGNKP